ncbi:hypothetical protein MUP38_03935 [Candidatus Bathyarchaeota archaeon]|nr:hypothetical protein [Candidatus Bathyarchaeota archaeon]
MRQLEKRCGAKGKLLVAILLLLLPSLASAAVVTSAGVWISGVAKGDFIYYEMYGIYTSSDPDAVIDVPPFERNTTDWVRIDIADVSGSVVHQVYTLHFKNGAETKFELQTDLDPRNAGNFNFTEKGVPLCAANLNVGDTLPTVQLTINDTLTRAYSSGEREINHVSWNSTEDWGDCYFDKKTGVPFEIYRVHKFTNKVTGETVEKTDIVKMTRSNLWAPKEPQITTVPPTLTTLITATPLLTTIAARKHNLTKKHGSRKNPV